MSTKSESFELSKPKAAGNNQKIVAALRQHDSLTRRELADATGMLLQTVCSCVNSLVKSGVLVSAGRRFDKATERNVEIVSIGSLTVREEIVNSLRNPA